MATQFERVTYRIAGHRRRTVNLEVIQDGPQFLVGVEVDSEGDRVQPAAAFLRKHSALHGNVRHVIEQDLVTRRVPMRQDHLTGRLVLVEAGQ